MKVKGKLKQNKIYVKKSPIHGFGVYADKLIRKGELIEECYAILTPGGDDILDDYYFDANGTYAFLTGFGSIYNHDDEPNANYTINKKTKVATIVADKQIKKGEEIFVSYGEEWFTTRKMQPKQRLKA